MKFATLLKSLVLLAAMSLLAACGGGTSGGDSAFQPATLKITATPSAGSVESGKSIDVRVVVTQANGTSVADGTVVSSSVSPASRGTLHEALEGNLGTAQAATVGGIANFRYNAAGSPGEATLTFSVTDDASAGRSFSTSVKVNVTEGQGRLGLSATRTTLPVNQYGVDPFMGSPYMAEVTVTVRDSNGQPLSGEDILGASINPVGNTGGFSVLDDPSTECDMETLDGCEFHQRLGQGPVNVVAGKATIFVHSLNFTGKSTLTVTSTDPVTGAVNEASMDFHFVENMLATPSVLGLAPPAKPVYAQGSGGNTSGVLHIEVSDPLGQPVPDPESGASAYNNYRLEIVGSASEGAPTLSGIDAAGNAVSGRKIDLATTNGIGAANVIAGTKVDSFIVRLTADRADNNIDNGITEPVVLERSVVISDGQLWNLEITQPTVNTLTINPSGGDIEVVGDLEVPMAPDGSYSVTVGVIATDRLGNPVLPGTTINFGLVDEPQATGVGDFYISGGDGDPQEGGKLFTADHGDFLSAGGGVGSGDTLLLLAKNVIGNRDLEAARVISEVHTSRSLSVTHPFNHNDTTGQSHNSGPIIPYVIGRAADGNIHAVASTNEMGVATTRMNYPVSRLGKVAAVWAQGDGEVVSDVAKKVADVEFLRFPGVAGENARLVVSPNVIPANTTMGVTICVYDALSAPIGGVDVGFQFDGLVGTGKVDGTPNAGVVGSPTALGTGCTEAEVFTSNVLENGSDETKLVFSAAGLSDEVTFTHTPMVLVASPSAMSSGGTVNLTLYDVGGVPQPGHKVFGVCESSGGAVVSITQGPGITNNDGKTSAVISASNLSQVGGAGSGKCTFFVGADESSPVSAVVTLQGQDLCDLGVSPPIPGCSTTPQQQHPLSVLINTGSVNGNYSITSSPGGVTCSVSGTNTASNCSPVQFDEGLTVTLTAVGPVGATLSGWSGDCVPVSGSPEQATVIINGSSSCTVNWN